MDKNIILKQIALQHPLLPPFSTYNLSFLLKLATYVCMNVQVVGVYNYKRFFVLIFQFR